MQKRQSEIFNNVEHGSVKRGGGSTSDWYDFSFSFPIYMYVGGGGYSSGMPLPFICLFSSLFLDLIQRY